MKALFSRRGWSLLSRSILMYSLLAGSASGAENAGAPLAAPGPTSGWGGGVVVVIGLIAFAVVLAFCVLLFIAPLKLYGIHRGIQRTNQLLEWQGKLLAQLVTEQGKRSADTSDAGPQKKW
jgi:hypothetical protein